MTRTGADSTNAEYLPTGREIYLGYIDGNYRSYDAIKARFPHALVVPIATQASGNVGTVGDGPPDNGTWPEWIRWVVRRRAAGVDPTIYTDASSWAEASQAFTHAGVAQPHWWIAKWDGIAEVPAGTVGKQYAEHTNRYDDNLFADYWPGVDPAPSAPSPAPPGAGGGGGGSGTGSSGPGPQLPSMRVKTMLLMNAGAAGIWLLSGSLYVHVVDVDAYHAFEAAGVAVVSIDAAQHAALLAAYQALTTAKVTTGEVPVSKA